MRHFAPSLTTSLPSDLNNIRPLNPGTETSEVFQVCIGCRSLITRSDFFFVSKRFGKSFISKSIFDGVKDLKNTLDPEGCEVIRQMERQIFLTGGHPNVELCVHRQTGEPLLRTRQPVPKDALLGQFVSVVQRVHNDDEEISFQQLSITEAWFVVEQTFKLKRQHEEEGESLLYLLGG